VGTAQVSDFQHPIHEDSLLELPEFEREAAIAQRLEEKQRIQDKLNLDRMVKAQNGPDSDKAKRRSFSSFENVTPLN